MAKRKAKKGKKTSRRRSVGALNANNPLVKFGPIVAGYFLGDKINDAISKATGDKVDGKILGGGEAALGAVLMMGKVGKGKSKMFAKMAGGVLLGAGAKKLLSEFGVINGFSDVPVISGYGDVPVIGGYNVPQAALNGYNVPKPMNVMGSVSEGTGSGLGYMDSDR